MSEGSAQTEAPALEAPAEQVKVNEQQQERIQTFLRASRIAGWIMLFPLLVVEIPALLFLMPLLYREVMVSSWLEQQPVPGWYPLIILAIYLFGVVFLLVLTFPLFFVQGYFLPRRYKMHQLTFLTWISQWLRGILRLSVNWFCLVECLSLFFALQPDLWWLWMSILLTFVSIVRTYFAPLYAFRRQERIPLTDESLVSMLNQLCANHKTHIHHFFLLKSKKKDQLVRANAFMAGWGRTSSILLTDGLLKSFLPAEIKSVVAHELGHHIHRHLIKRQLLHFGLLLAELFLYYQAYHWLLSMASTSDITPHSFVILGVLLGLLAICLRLCFFMARRRYRYQNEYWADEFALQATLDVPAFKNAMLRLGNLNNIPLKLSSSQEKGRTHPSTMLRLQHADEFALRLARAREEKKHVKMGK